MSRSPRHRPFRVLGARTPIPSPEKAADRERAAAHTDFKFSEAVASAGVQPLTHRNRRVHGAAKSSPTASLRPAPSAAFTVIQADDWLQGYRTNLGPRTLQRLRTAPSSTLDLHGASAKSARQALVRFLGAERAHGHRVVLVIVGKGRHSAGGQGVLRGEVVDWLTSAPAAAHVLAFDTAPPRWGGTGGVLVLLSTEPRKSAHRRAK